MSGQLEPNYCAIRDYRPVHDGEIELVAGDSITNVKDLTNGWMLGRNATRNTVGIFPSHLILPEAVPTTTSSGACAAPPTLAAATTTTSAGVADPTINLAALAAPPPLNGPRAAPSNTSTGPLVDITDDNFDSGDFPPPPTEEELILPVGALPSTTSGSAGPDPHPQIPNYDPPRAAKQPNLNHYERLAGAAAAAPKRRKSREKERARGAPVDTEVALEVGVEAETTNSLPSPRKGRYGRAAPKPHMFVRPNAVGNSKSIFRQPSDTSVKGGAASESSDGQGSPEECRARTYSNPSCQSTPTPTRHRPAPPPPGMRISTGDDDFLMDEAVELDSPLGGGQHTSGATVIANVSPEQELTPTDGDYVPGVLGGQPTVGGHYVNPRAAAVSQQQHQSERQNLTNEGISRSTPPPHALNEPKPAFYSDYRTLECPDPNKTPPVVQKRYKPILKNRHAHHHAHHHGGGNHHGYGSPSQKANEICYRDERQTNRSFRLLCSVLAGLLFGLVLFAWMYYALEYALMVALLTSVCVAVLSMLAFAVSRLCRCVGGLLIPSVCTTRGRIAFLVLITGFLLDGPVSNIYTNMGEVSRAMACSAEQSYNQSMLLLQPFDAMMQNLNSTVYRLQDAAHNVSLGLRPLDDGLDMAELDLFRARLELTGTERTCRHLIDVAFADCAEGIAAAKNQCLGVLGTLGTVYHHARDVLDRINPTRWAPKQTISLQKRQVIFGSELDNIPESDRDICEPLDRYTVCVSLNDSDLLCHASGWAGEAVYDAINSTQQAMRRLQRTLQFEINPEPYVTTRINASKVLYSVRRKVHDEFYGRTLYFHEVISILMKIVPIALLLLIYVSYLHVKNYVSKDTYDNVYVTPQFKTLDQKRCEYAGESLLPLKKYERNYLIETSISELSPPEDGLYRLGLLVLCLHLLLAFTCYMFDYILYWILAMISKHGDPQYDFTGKDSLQLVVSGEGVITDLLHVFLKGFHPANLFGYTLDLHVCLPDPTPPSILLLLVVFLLYFALILSILLKAYILRFRNRITAYFYPEREKARVVHLYNVVLNQRFRMPKLLQLRAKVNYREKQTREQISVCHRLAAKVPLCRVFVYKQAHCLVCDCIEDQTFRDCQTEHCQGVYCGECYDDLSRLCPICHQAEYSDDEDYEELEDDLQPYCRSSKIYV